MRSFESRMYSEHKVPQHLLKNTRNKLIRRRVGSCFKDCIYSSIPKPLAPTPANRITYLSCPLSELRELLPDPVNFPVQRCRRACPRREHRKLCLQLAGDGKGGRRNGRRNTGSADEVDWKRIQGRRSEHLLCSARDEGGRVCNPRGNLRP